MRRSTSRAIETRFRVYEDELAALQESMGGDSGGHTPVPLLEHAELQARCSCLEDVYELYQQEVDALGARERQQLDYTRRLEAERAALQEAHRAAARDVLTGRNAAEALQGTQEELRQALQRRYDEAIEQERRHGERTLLQARAERDTLRVRVAELEEMLKAWRAVGAAETVATRHVRPDPEAAAAEAAAARRVQDLEGELRRSRATNAALVDAARAIFQLAAGAHADARAADAAHVATLGALDAPCEGGVSCGDALPEVPRWYDDAGAARVAGESVRVLRSWVDAARAQRTQIAQAQRDYIARQAEAQARLQADRAESGRECRRLRGRVLIAEARCAQFVEDAAVARDAALARRDQAVAVLNSTASQRDR